MSHEGNKKQAQLRKLHDTLKRLASAGKIKRETGDAIWPILKINLERERQLSEEDAYEAYIVRVAKNFERNHAKLQALQQERDEQLWLELFTKLKQWAYRHLLHKGFVPEQHTINLAQTYATEAAMVLLETHFPYDTEIDPWAIVILQRTCNRHMRRAVAQKRNPAGGETSLSDEQAFLQNALAVDLAQRQETWLQMVDAIERLPNDIWREVLWLRYIDGLSPAEIASQLNKTPEAIYGLHFRAISELRKSF